MSDLAQSSSNDNQDRALATYEDDLERMINENVLNGQDFQIQKLFLGFQNAAKEVTKMFRERSNGTANWNTFHAAAESVTMLYKESLDALKDAIQLGIINGEHRKTKELLCWTRRKQRRHLRTDEIYNYLISQSSNAPIISDIDSIHGAPTNQISPSPIVDDLQTFRQALVMDDQDNNNHANHLQSNSTADRSETSEQLESFVRQQMANQLARKRTYYSTDLLNNSNATDFQKVKRIRYT